MSLHIQHIHLCTEHAGILILSQKLHNSDFILQFGRFPPLFLTYAGGVVHVGYRSRVRRVICPKGHYLSFWNGVVQIPKFDPNHNPNPNSNPMPICFRQMTLRTSELSPFTRYLGLYLAYSFWLQGLTSGSGVKLYEARRPSWLQPAGHTHSGFQFFCIHYDWWRWTGIAPVCIGSPTSVVMLRQRIKKRNN